MTFKRLVFQQGHLDIFNLILETDIQSDLNLVLSQDLLTWNFHIQGSFIHDGNLNHIRIFPEEVFASHQFSLKLTIHKKQSSLKLFNLISAHISFEQVLDRK